MKYLKRPIPESEMDTMRINLSVQERKLSAEPVCDFCGGPKPLVEYAATRMQSGEVCDCWRWLACETCEAAVDADEWHIVHERLVARLKSMAPPVPVVLLGLAATQALEEFHRYAIRGE